MLNGSCLCGTVRYEIDGALGEMSHCHCSMCRKAHGAAFGTYAPVAWRAFRFVAGEETVQRYRSSEHIVRTFCRQCGATLQFIPDAKAGFELAVATLDTDPGMKPSYQIWTESKAPWWDLDNTLPSYAKERTRS